MNINQLRYFIGVAECQSFTKAASRYYITQTAITQQIRALENHLGVQLFDRNTRPVRLTPEGSVFLREAKGILERVEQAEHRVREASVGLVGSLKVGYIKGYERSSLSDRLRSFHNKYPNILISCYRWDTGVLETGLQKGDYDIIVTWNSEDSIKNGDTDGICVERSPLTVVLYESHPFARRQVLRREELAQEPFIYMTLSEDGNSFGDLHFLELYQKAGYQPHILFQSNDIESILMMVAAEEGISILPAFVTSKITNGDNLKFIPLEGEEEFVDISALWKKNRRNQILEHFLKEISLWKRREE